MRESSHLYFRGIPKPAMRSDRSNRERARSTTGVAPNAQVSEFYVWLFNRAELPLAHYRTRSLVRRLGACLRALGVSTVDEAQRRIEAQPSLVEIAINTVLLGVTEFCRDAAVFRMLRETVLPDLFNRVACPRIWSAACSDGHELYSVAILLSEMQCLGRAELLGTDCRSAAVKRAQSGLFPPNALENLDPSWRSSYFQMNGSNWLVRTELRDSICWRVADLFARVEPGPWHLILWRNMAIYLNPHSSDVIWRGLVDRLHPQGYLIAGKAEHPPPTLPLERVAACVYRRTPPRSPAE